jgi:Zn-dependent protease with chaperone function
MSARDEPQGRVQRRYAAFVERRDQAMLVQLKQADSLKPRFSFSKLLAYIIAFLIHAVTFLLPLLGLALILSQVAGLLSLCCGLMFIMIAWWVRPRFDKAPEDIVSRDKFPTLYRFTDQIAETLHTSSIDAIVINEFHNAGFARYGVRRSRVLILGYPLWSELDNQERVALLAHELAHELNGDLSRGFFVGNALHTLANWFELIVPGPLDYGLSRLVMGLLAEFLLLWIFLINQLLLYERRRAEYLADYLGSTIGGTEATISLLTKLQAHERRSVAVVENDHPATKHRIEFLQSRSPVQPAMTLEEDISSLIEAELAPLDSDMRRRIEQLRNRGWYY